MEQSNIEIKDVSDTAVWVAYYRQVETERPDALFKDPFAKVLVGERGKAIAEYMQTVGTYAQWSVISRTVMIDQFIKDLIQKENVDVVVNMGAGLDTRPYRMDLPATLQWVEVDYPKIIEMKSQKLSEEKPRCQLKRVALDLSDDISRRQFLTEVNSEGRKILVLTEGVIPYLPPEAVRKLADDLNFQSNIQFWITEYFHQDVYKYLNSRVRNKKMKNAPFLFYPDDWIEFFAQSSWRPRELQYSAQVALKSGRKPPMPWFFKIVALFMSRKTREKAQKMSGYMIFDKSKKS